jgi:hypothetical protein
MRRVLFFALVVWVVLLGVGGNTAVVAQTSNPDRIFIVGEPQAERFPEIGVQIRAVDGNNKAILALTDRQIKVFENGRPVSSWGVAPSDRTPTYVVFVIDQGQYFSPGNRRDAIVEALRQWVQEEGQFRDGFDTVAILSREVVDGRDQTREILPPTKSQNSFLNAVNQLDLASGSGRTDGLAGVDDALSLLRRLVPQTGDASTAVVYIGSIIENSGGQAGSEREATAMAAKARTQNTPIHALDSDASHRFAAPMENLTNGSGGVYVPLSANRSNAADVRAAYQTIIDQAQTHLVTYPSNYDINVDNPGARNVVIVPANIPLDAAEETATYTIDPKPPTVRITSPQADSVIDRAGSLTSSGASSYGLNATDLEVVVDWGSGAAPRTISEVFLAVDGEFKPATITSQEGNRLRLTWDVSQFENVRKTVNLQVRVRDVLGLEAVTTAVPITINATLPTPTPRPTTPPTATPPGPILGGSENGNTTLIIGGGIGLFLLVAVLIAAFFFSRQSSTPTPAPSSPSGGFPAPNRFEATMVGGQAMGAKAIAKVDIEVARKELVGETIDLYANRTTFGRNPTMCDVQLYDQDEKSSVSGLHCTIQYDQAQRKFFLTDDNSSNGTFVNGTRLRPNMPHQLQDDTVIILGSIGRRGAKIRFHTVAATGGSASPAYTPASAEADKTMVDMGMGLTPSDNPNAGIMTDLGIPHTPATPLPPSSPLPSIADEGGATIIDSSPLPSQNPLPRPFSSFPADEDRTMPSQPYTPSGKPASPPPSPAGKEDDSWLDEL